MEVQGGASVHAHTSPLGNYFYIITCALDPSRPQKVTGKFITPEGFGVASSQQQKINDKIKALSA